MYVAQPGTIWGVALAVAPAFHRPAFKSDGAYSTQVGGPNTHRGRVTWVVCTPLTLACTVQVSTAILATPQLAAWPTPHEAPPEVEISEHLLIEGPNVRRPCRAALVRWCSHAASPPRPCVPRLSRRWICL